MNKHLLAASALAFTAFASQALADNPGAQRWPLWYLGLSGGVSFLGDTDIGKAKTGNLDYDTGAIATASIGYMPAFTGPLSGLRFEAEGGYHYNSLSSAVVNGAAVATDGRTQTVSYMGNAFYDFRNTSQWTPYVGAGAGGARVMLSKSSGLGNTNDHDNVFAYQFMAGIAYSPATLPMTQWTLGYRYFVAQSPEFATAAGKVELDDMTSHNVEVGARFRF